MCDAVEFGVQLYSVMLLCVLFFKGLTRGRTNLIIVDRSIDLAPLLLHEFTYQVGGGH